MPRNPFGHCPHGFTADDWRKEAAKWETVAAQAQVDGDKSYAEDAKRQAAACRQKARLMEADHD